MATAAEIWRRNRWLIAALLTLWTGVTFGVPYFGKNLHFKFFGWPFSFWMAAQGALLVYLLIIVVYGKLMNRWDADRSASSETHDAPS
jgi:putative solute:sodium symporter small subunit